LTRLTIAEMMAATPVTKEPLMAEYLTLEEIEARYAPDWVLIDEPKTDDLQQLLGGIVVECGPDRDDLYRKASELGLHHVAVRKLGPWLEEMVLLL